MQPGARSSCLPDFTNFSPRRTSGGFVTVLKATTGLTSAIRHPRPRASSDSCTNAVPRIQLWPQPYLEQLSNYEGQASGTLDLQHHRFAPHDPREDALELLDGAR